MAKSFSKAEWAKINRLMSRARLFGLPVRRDGSVVIGSFNIRKLGAVAKKSPGAWAFFVRVLERFDLIALQEVQDDLGGLKFVKQSLGSRYGMVVSDITGSYPGQSPPPERLAFLFKWDVIERTEVASDISYDRGRVVRTLIGEQEAFWIAFEAYENDMKEYEKEKAARKAAGKKAPSKPVPHLPEFLTFIRQPHCVSFQIKAKSSSAQPISFLAVNAHLLYGKYKDERYKEFTALVGWLVDRAKQAARMYHPNVILLGDCNLDFSNPVTSRTKIDAFLKSRNIHQLKGKRAKLNFPLLDVHPQQSEVFRTNARLSETYDQIGFVAFDPRLPKSGQNGIAGATANGYDYGVFNFVDLFSQAIYQSDFRDLNKKNRNTLLSKFQHDVTDHLPIWIRLPRP